MTRRGHKVDGSHVFALEGMLVDPVDRVLEIATITGEAATHPRR